MKALLIVLFIYIINVNANSTCPIGEHIRMKNCDICHDEDCVYLVVKTIPVDEHYYLQFDYCDCINKKKCGNRCQNYNASQEEIISCANEGIFCGNFDVKIPLWSAYNAVGIVFFTFMIIFASIIPFILFIKFIFGDDPRNNHRRLHEIDGQQEIHKPFLSYCEKISFLCLTSISLICMVIFIIFHLKIKAKANDTYSNFMCI